MKIMFLTIEGFDTPNSNNHLTYRLIKDLLLKGQKVYLVESNRNGESKDVPYDLEGDENFEYDVIPRKSVKKTNFIARYFEGINFFYKAQKVWKDRIKEVDVCIVQSTPTAWYAIKNLSKNHKKKVVFSIYDVFPDGIFEISGMKKGFLFKTLSHIQSKAYGLCEKIVVLSNDMKQKLISNGVQSNKIEVIVSWYDETVIREVEPDENKFIKKYKIDHNKKYVQYAGNFGYTFDWNMVLEVANILKRRDDIVFQMIGSGTFENNFKNEVKGNDLENVTFYPWQSLDIIMDVYSAATIAFIPLSKKVLGNSHPSKASLLMACGRTFVCTAAKDSDLINTYNQLRVAKGISDDNPKAAADAIELLIDNLSLRHEYERAANKYAIEELSSTINTDKFFGVIKACKGVECE